MKISYICTMERIVLNYEPNDTFAKKMIEALLESGAFSIGRKKRESEFRKSIEEGLKTDSVGRDEVMKALDDEYFVAEDAKDAIRKCLA